MADLTITVDVRNEQTMSSYMIPPSGKLTYENKSEDFELVISSKSADAPLPFCESNGNTPIPLPLVVPKDGSATVKICDAFTGNEFLYTAQIGNYAAEDPIVIIERSKNLSLDPLAALFIGAGIGAALAYLIVKSRAKKMHPQQG
jgi:hypothetical protein